MSSYRSYIGVDLDGTLAYQGPEEYNPYLIGHPIPQMVKHVRGWLEAGKEVRIFTARAAHNDAHVNNLIGDWTEKHLGRRLEVTNKKDLYCEAIFDDRAYNVERNQGVIRP